MTDHASDYTYWWIKYEDGGYTVRCGLCDDSEPISGAPHVVEVKADEFVRRHRARGYKACLVLQDRMTVDDVLAAKPDAVFVGGTDEFKLGPRARDILAAFDGPKHMGRVNSRKRLMYAARIGCDTADGTVFAFDPTRRVVAWVEEINAQYQIGGDAA